MNRTFTLFFHNLPLLVVGLLLLSGCNKEEVPPVTPPDIVPEKGVFIVNEGGFTFGNASVSYYDFTTTEVQHQLFKAANGFGPGDVLQSMAIHEEMAYLVLNNSNKIEVVDPVDFRQLGTIGGLNSPRYLAFSGSKAYATDLYADAIYIIDLPSRQLEKQIPIDGWTEELLLIGQQLFVCNRESNWVYVLDIDTASWVDSISVAPNPSAIVEDMNQQIWVLCSGQESPAVLGGLFRIDPMERRVTKQLYFTDMNIGGWPRLEANEAGDTLYYLKNDLFQFPIAETGLPVEPLVKAEGQNWYGLGIRPSDGTILLGDAVDYQQKGVVYHFRQDGSLINSFAAGVIPNGFAFY